MPEGERILERQLRELLDKEEIRDLALLYCHHVRAREIDKIVDQYAEDAAFELPEGLEEGLSGPHGGREAIRASLVAGLPLYEPWPFVHNHIIDIVSEERALGWLHAEVRMGSRNLKTGMIVSYEDEYVKEKGSWKFRSRKVNATFLDRT